MRVNKISSTILSRFGRYLSTFSILFYRDERYTEHAHTIWKTYTIFHSWFTKLTANIFCESKVKIVCYRADVFNLHSLGYAVEKHL